MKSTLSKQLKDDIEDISYYIGEEYSYKLPKEKREIMLLLQDKILKSSNEQNISLFLNKIKELNQNGGMISILDINPSIEIFNEIMYDLSPEGFLGYSVIHMETFIQTLEDLREKNQNQKETVDSIIIYKRMSNFNIIKNNKKESCLEIFGFIYNKGMFISLSKNEITQILKIKEPTETTNLIFCDLNDY